MAPIAAMPVAKATVPTPALHRRDLGFERGGRGVALAAVGVAARAPLEHGGELVGVAIGVGHRQMQGLVQRAVLDRRIAVGMQDGGGESALGVVAHVVSRCSFREMPENKKPVGHAA